MSIGHKRRSRKATARADHNLSFNRRGFRDGQGTSEEAATGRECLCACNEKVPDKHTTLNLYIGSMSDMFKGGTSFRFPLCWETAIPKPVSGASIFDTAEYINPHRPTSRQHAINGQRRVACNCVLIRTGLPRG